jgi:hypothetical protein
MACTFSGSTPFSVRFSRRSSRGLPPLTIGGPSAPPTSAIGRRRLIKDGTSRGLRNSQRRTRRSPHIGTCGVQHCAGTTTQRRGAPRAMLLPGTPREAPPCLVLSFSKEAAGVPSAWSQPFNPPPRDHADGATLGRHGRTRRPVLTFDIPGRRDRNGVWSMPRLPPTVPIPTTAEPRDRHVFSFPSFFPDHGSCKRRPALRFEHFTEVLSSLNLDQIPTSSCHRSWHGCTVLRS